MQQIEKNSNHIHLPYYKAKRIDLDENIDGNSSLRLVILSNLSDLLSIRNKRRVAFINDLIKLLNKYKDGE